MSTQADVNSLTVGDWLVEPMCTRIQRAGSLRPVQPLSMDILVYLAERAGNVVGTTELLERFWPDRYAGSDAVHRRIANIRSALEDDTANPRYIETIRKRGYRLIAEVSREAIPASGLPVTQLLNVFSTRQNLELEFELRSGRKVFARGTLSVEGTARR